MGELGALFNPGMRHEQEERRAKALRREEEGNARDSDPRIDLESGVAVITTDEADSDHHGAVSQSPPSPDRAAGDDLSTDPTDAAVAPAPVRPRPRGKRGLMSGSN